MSNAGGTGKTTLAIHLAYTVAIKGYQVCIVELDPQGSIKQFTGLDEPEADQSICISLLDGVKDIGWNPTPIWKDYTPFVSVIQGGRPLGDRLKEVQNHPRGNYLLDGRLKERALDADLIIFDNNASIDQLGLLSLAASTHILVPLQCEPKAADGAAGLTSWFYNRIGALGLSPEPEILGFVPFRVNSRIGAHAEIAAQLPEVLASFEIPIHCFSKVRDSNEFLNASKIGVPLHVYRPKHPAISDFNPIAARLISIMEGKQ